MTLNDAKGRRSRDASDPTPAETAINMCTIKSARATDLPREAHLALEILLGALAILSGANRRTARHDQEVLMKKEVQGSLEDGFRLT